MISSQGSEGPRRGLETVLLAEDEKFVRQVFLRALRQEGYTVLEAADGAEGLHLAEEHAGPIHLLVTDVSMPRMNGVELARQLLLQRPQVKVIFMSGYSDDGTLREEMSKLGTLFLQKPFTPKILLFEVRQVLDG